MKQAAAAARQARLTRVLGSARVPAQTPVPIASDSNDVWRIGAVVLRICWRGDRDRFAREAAVTAALPPSMPYPEIVDAGRNDELAWQVTRGRPKRGRAACSAGWPKATRPRSRRQACSPACGCTRSPTASARCSSTVPGGPPANWPVTSSCGDSAASSPVQAISNGSCQQLRKGKPLRDGCPVPRILLLGCAQARAPDEVTVLLQRARQHGEMHLPILVDSYDPDHRLAIAVTGHQHHTRTNLRGIAGIARGRPAEPLIVFSVEVGY